MKKYFDILRSCPLFEQISDEDLPGMLACLGAKVVAFDKRQTVIAEGDKAKYVGIVLSGAVQITQVDYFGNRSILSEATASELFAEAFACAKVESIPVSVVTSEASEIMFIECERLTTPCSRACGFHRQIIYNLLKIVATKNLLFHQKLEISSKRTTREKLTTFLLLQAKKSQSNRFSIPFDRQELADYLGVDRSGLSVELGKMQREGILKYRKNSFELLATSI